MTVQVTPTRSLSDAQEICFILLDISRTKAHKRTDEGGGWGDPEGVRRARGRQQRRGSESRCRSRLVTDAEARVEERDPERRRAAGVGGILLYLRNARITGVQTGSGKNEQMSL